MKLVYIFHSKKLSRFRTLAIGLCLLLGVLGYFREGVYLRTFSSLQGPYFPSLATTRARNTALQHHECLLGIQQTQVQQIDEWFRRDSPFLANVILIESLYHLVFETRSVSDVRRWRHAAWKCNGREEASRINVPKDGFTLIVLCPKTSAPLEFVQVVAEPLPTSSVANQTEIYNLIPFRDCDVLARQDLAYRNQVRAVTPPTNPLPRLAACTSVRGSQIRAVVDQWVEYHHILGIEHFYIYINEPWQNLTGLPQRPYITYIPFDYCICNHLDTIQELNRTDLLHSVYWAQYPFYQELVNTDCVFRTRQAKFDWITTTDVDEYIRILTPTAEAQNWTGSNPLLEPKLQHFLQQHYPERDSIAGLRMVRSVSYGRNRFDPEEEGKHFELMIDYKWRRNASFLDMPADREKIIVNPDLVSYLCVHTIKQGEPTIDLSPFQMHLNHYKNPERGPFRDARNPNVVPDEELTAYHSVIMDRLQTLPNPEFVYSNN